MEVEVEPSTGLSTKSLIFRDHHETWIFGHFSTLKVTVGRFKPEEDC